MHLGILGLGGIGGILSALFSMHNVSYECIRSKKNNNLFEKDYLELRSERYGDYKFIPVILEDSIKNLDILFISVKAQYLEESLKSISKINLNNTIIIPLLNGIGHIEMLKKKFGEELLLGTIGNIESQRSGNTILHKSNKLSPKIEFYKGKKSQENIVNKIIKILKDVGIDADVLDTEAAVVWKKLVRLDAISSFTTAYNMTVGELLDNNNIKNKMYEYLSETIMVAAKDGYISDAKTIMSQIEKLPYSLRTSMQKDVHSNKVSEVDFITGGVLNLGTKFNIDMHEHNYIYKKIKNL